MKKSIRYILGLLCLPFAFAACEKIEPELFDESESGAYFDYEYAAEFDRTLNFSDYIVGHPDSVTMTFKVKLLGHLLDESRTLSVKVKGIDGYELPEFTMEEVVFANKEYEKELRVKVKRPEVEDSMYAVCIYLDGSGDIGIGIGGKSEMNLYVTESYTQPAAWNVTVDEYMGVWSKEKHIALAELTGDNHFYSSFLDRDGKPSSESIIAMNIRVVNALLANEPAVPIALEIPISEGAYVDYDMPYFWTEYEDVIGPYRAGKFRQFVREMGGSNTKDVAALFASDEARQKMEEKMEEYHKNDVYFMLKNYDEYAMSGLPLEEYWNLFRVAIKNDVIYTFVDKVEDKVNVGIPFWWSDPKYLGTAQEVKKYFGEYDAGKYQFMLVTMSVEDGIDDFLAASLFPFVYVKESRSFAWDDTPFGKDRLSGEARLKECYRIIKAANDDLLPDRRYDFPDVELE